MMKEIQDKLSIWGRLYKECEQLELQLRSAQSGDKCSGPDRAVLEAELKALKARTDAAFKEASEALKKKEAKARRTGDH